MELAAGAAQSTSAWAQPGTLGFLVVFGMGVVLYFVFRSMSRHLRKINQAARGLPDAVQADAVQADAGQSPSGRSSLGRGSLGQGLPPAR
jgi:hypothetical protein